MVGLNKVRIGLKSLRGLLGLSSSITFLVAPVFGSINISEVLLRCKLLTLLAKSTSHNDTLEHQGHVLKSRMVIVALESQWLEAKKMIKFNRYCEITELPS